MVKQPTTSKRHLPLMIVIFLTAVFIAYFFWFTYQRYDKLWASYFDLGIMHQTVYNTFRSIQTGDVSRFLEMTDPHHSGEQVKRMAVHNDIFLALISLFMFITISPALLLWIQVAVVGLGAIFVFFIAKHLLARYDKHSILPVIFSGAYLMYPALQRSVIFDFHSVTLATTFLLAMFYFWQIKRWGWSFFFLFLSLTTKEQIGVTTAFFGLFTILYPMWQNWLQTGKVVAGKAKFGILVIGISLIWVFVSFYIISVFRGQEHFATKYYGDFGDSPATVAIGILKNPLSLITKVLNTDSLLYYLFMFGPVGFLVIFAPLYLLIASPEFGVNLLSNSWGMKQIIYHYTAVITPIVFIAAIAGAKTLLVWNKKYLNPYSIATIVTISTFIFSVWKSPLFYSLEADTYALQPAQIEVKEVKVWAKKLQDERISVSTTGHMAPFFTARRYFYDFSKQYDRADYVLIQKNEVSANFQQDITIPAYIDLQKDPRFELIRDKNGIQVYKKIPPEK